MAAFLKNSGDIILDAVLTDYGRRLLARGDGSFNITKFAFGDDEIDYKLFKPKNDSSTQDLDIMNTPILEAFTNNAASMKSKLMTMSDDMLLYLPVLKLNTLLAPTGSFGNGTSTYFDGYVIPVDVGTTTEAYSSYKLKNANGDYLAGVLPVNNNDFYIAVDQGLDTSDLSGKSSLKNENFSLYENEYNVFVDDRYCELISINDGTILKPISVDDDGIAVYKFTETINSKDVMAIPVVVAEGQSDESNISGPKGSRFKFKISPKSHLKGSDSYFTKYGKTLNFLINNAPVPFKTLRMSARVVSVTSGYSLDLAVLFAKT